MTPVALLVVAALLLWANAKTTRQPTKALTFHAGWGLLILAVVLALLGVPHLGVLL